MKPIYCVDANIILRFLLNDHPLLSQKAKQFVQRAEQGEIRLYVDEVIVAEVIWVLTSFYEVKREIIGEKLTMFLVQSWVENARKQLLVEAVGLYQHSSLDYIDAWIIVVAESAGLPIETFDDGLRRLVMKRVRPKKKN